MRNWFLTLALWSNMVSYAITIPQGTIYFDNSLTDYNHVQFVCGYDNQDLSYVYTMTFDGEKWKVSIPHALTNIYRYTFANTQLAEGAHAQRFSDLKEYISKSIYCNRTATRDDYVTAGYIFVPETGDNWAQGSWMSLSAWKSTLVQPTATCSGTLPIIYIQTNNNVPITSKDDYISASYYLLDTLSGNSIGSQDAMLPLSIKGRGNYTWTGFDKKPYRIKLESGVNFLGMNKSKHWALMAAADDDLGFLRNSVGYMLSETLGLRWTPAQRPVELVLNHQYKGLYFLTEIIRIDKDRVNITQQEENCTLPDSITGGWLVEIDNYKEEGNVEFEEGNGQFVMVTIKDPEVLSSAQRNYITNQLYTLNNAFYQKTSTQWEQLVDLDEAVRYYIVQEIMEDCESYHGSCYLYKDIDREGIPSKWFFGPVWDFGNAYMRRQNRFIYDQPSWPQYWIGQIASFPVFQQRVKELWKNFYNNSYITLADSIQSFAGTLMYAAANDAVCWKNSSNVRTNGNMSERSAIFLNLFHQRIAWLQSQWGSESACAVTQSAEAHATKTIQEGCLVIEHNGVRFTAQGIRLP